MGTSHTVVTKGLELSIDESSDRFSIGIGTGFQTGPEAKERGSVNVEIVDLSLEELEAVALRFVEIVMYYQSGAQASQFMANLQSKFGS